MKITYSKIQRKNELPEGIITTDMVTLCGNLVYQVKSTPAAAAVPPCPRG